MAFTNPRPGWGRFGPPTQLEGRASFGQRPPLIPRGSPNVRPPIFGGGGFGRAVAFGALAADVAIGLYVAWQAYNIWQGHRRPGFVPDAGLLISWGYTEDLTKHCGGYNMWTTLASYPSCGITFQVLPSSIGRLFTGRPPVIVKWLDTFTVNIVNGNHNCYGAETWKRTIALGPSLAAASGWSYDQASPYYVGYMPTPDLGVLPVALALPLNWTPYVPVLLHLPDLRHCQTT